jgi:UDP-3-O-acyl-N-acetylglucosamine deacetylase
LNAPEPPGCDGSSRHFAESLLDAGLIEQDAPRRLFVIQEETRVGGAEQGSEVVASPLLRHTLAITYQLDYGPRSPIRPQLLTVEVSPEMFLNSLAASRTFLLEAEAEMLRAQGYGQRISEKDLLILGPEGVIGNELRWPDECVRHKLLDCLGDFALIGCDVYGHFRAFRSGHQLNQQIIRQVKAAHPEEFPQRRSAAA